MIFCMCSDGICTFSTKDLKFCCVSFDESLSNQTMYRGMMMYVYLNV